MEETRIDAIARSFGSSIPTSRNEFFEYVLENIDEIELLGIHNDGYCTSYPDDYIYNNTEDEINEVFNSNSPYDIACALEGADWRSHHEYFKYDGYGNLESFDNVTDKVDTCELADYCCKHPSYIEDFIDEDEIMYAFLHGAYGVEQLTEEEIGEIDYSTLIDTDWDEVIQDIIDDRE